jgi:tryptophan halogenase
MLFYCILRVQYCYRYEKEQTVTMQSKSNDDDKAIKSIVVAGGGAAGWLTAAVIAAEHNVRNNSNLSVTLVESPDVKILGVGEGTWPTMRDTLRKIGVDENEFLIACDASFKQGTRFVDWRTEPSNQTVDIYDHPFSLPAGFFEGNVGAWWLLNEPDNRKQHSFSHTVSTQSSLCDAYIAPKQAQTPPYAAVANYGYHLDAHKFAEFLRKHCVDVLGVKHVRDHIKTVITDNDNNISILECAKSSIKGDLFVDCTGFAATLISGHYHSRLTDVSQGLKNDSAVAIQAPYLSDDVDIASATLSTAHKNGWIWDIGLPHRKGIGCVYSSEFCNEDTAVDTLLAYASSCEKTAPVSSDAVRKISFNPGYRKKAWVNNCVAVGTSAGFVEPLEASALVMVELSAKFIAQNLPAHNGLMRAVSNQFNANFSQRWERIVDFLKLHYVLSERRDSAYWTYMSNKDNASEQLQEWLMQWKYRPITTADFIYAEELFPAASYMYVLYGMKQPRSFRLDQSRYREAVMSATASAIQQTQHRGQQQLSVLPSNRTLINTIRAAGRA